MICAVIGLRRVDMQNDNVHGWSVYSTREEANVEGLLADRFFISDEMLRRDMSGLIPSVGQIMEFEFNSRGKVGKIIAFKDA